ncbi:hypothetical protein DPMN_079190 [Dreissena polymorpha]|uniref:Uncharacterized protein n=1 Tax=Dreissena polymorpha TaxID=45954 RepID=A0A9D3YSN3_DREPO|nr:hypothetical protein DPMN_079190 [Dreissena polymorpha]
MGNTIEKGSDVVQDQVITFNRKSEYDISVSADSNVELLHCIRDICVLPSGQVLIADMNKVKLLNQQYQVVSQCRLSGQPWGICQITPSDVGVTVGSEIQFIKVNNSQLVTDRKLQLQHDCKSIAYHEGDLFVTSGTALYKYTLSGTLVGKLHEHNSKDVTGKNYVGFIYINKKFLIMISKAFVEVIITRKKKHSNMLSIMLKNGY